VLAVEEAVHRSGSPERAQALLDAARTEPWWPLLQLPDRVPPEEESAEWREEMDFDPEPIFAHVRVPTLLVYGEDDDWVPVDASVETWTRARGGEVEIVLLPETGHEPRRGSTVSPLYEERLIAWLRARS
jgi:pimeloyl-ACP methyl ester carboxylesterase